ncbi:MAG: Phosphoglycerate mutase [Polyangiaceae bacterium]|jgi:probable phosphoglycerate mutase|nr:Phosphoglycerate mutase [Polyangiaceae bacterium]
MELLIVRHGESVANAEGRMQGQSDYPLSELGQRQAAALGRFLSGAGYRFDACYTSPLTRARSTALALTTALGLPEAELEPSLAELHAGSLQGLTRDEIAARYPTFMQRGLNGLGDFAEYGGESYDDVQRRVQQLVERWHHRHLVDAHRVLAVAHGGVNFQLLKALICDPVPRVMSVKFGNCCATLVRVRERRGVYLGELVFHLPVDLLGARTSEGMVGVF